MKHRSESHDPTLTAITLKSTPCFAQLPHEAIVLLANLMAVRVLEAGEVLAREGDSGETLFLVKSGSLSVMREPLNDQPRLQLGVVKAGEITGELTLLTGHPRSATIEAAEPTTVGLLSKESFDQLCAQFPAEMAASLEWMAERLHRYQITNAIAESRLLSELSQEAKGDLAESFQAVDLRAGEILFREGEPGNELYLILSGRVRIELGKGSEAATPAHVLAELGKGDLLGEMALLTGETRSATAVAVRDSQLARLDRSAFDRIVAANPQQMLSLVSCQLSGRLRAQNAGRRAEGRPPVSIAVLPLGRSTGASGASSTADFARELTQQLTAFGPTLHLNSAELTRILGGDPLRARDGKQVNSATEAASERRLLSWLGEQEMAFRHVVYEADATNSPWTSRCVRQADTLLVVADAASDPLECAHEFQRHAQEMDSSLGRTLVLLHAEGQLPSGKTSAWKRALDIPMHEHVRRNNTGDVGRIARRLNRQSVGLALGGGFALGLAHIGVIDAMRHLQIPIDFVGGTSMGAIIGVACAQEFTHAQMLEVMDKGCVQALKGDYTLPMVSLLTGRKVGLALGEYLEGLEIEDLMLPYFSISASLVNARMVVHREGSALRSVLASCRAPGMFPPLEWNGDVLVDGGLVNNIPADVMREFVGGGTVFAADVSPKHEFKDGAEFGLHLSGWRVAARNANPFRRGERIGTLGDILMRMIRLGGVAHNREIRSMADLYFSIPLQKFSIRDFHCGEEMAQVGYEYTLATLNQWISQHGRPWLGLAGRLPDSE